MAGAKIPLTFRIHKGDELLREETLSQPVIKVGKLSSSHLRLDDESVSRMHAVIEVSAADDISIIDLGSTKGHHGQRPKGEQGEIAGPGDQIVYSAIFASSLHLGAVPPKKRPSPTLRWLLQSPLPPCIAAPAPTAAAPVAPAGTRSRPPRRPW